MTEMTLLDAQGLSCPMPVLRASKRLKEVPAGGTLRVLTTDPGSVKDFEAFCRQTGNELLESTEADGAYAFLIRRSG
ncbi:MAG: sulfurtransferase TusA family protein [Alphaproteobacteria bacterium]